MSEKTMQIRNSTIDFLTFTRQSGEDSVEVRVQDNDVWLTQASIAKLFGVERSVVTKHLKKIFEDEKEPLFGRATGKINLTPFSPSVCKEILGDYNPGYTNEDLLCLYMLSGGVAKYISLLMDSGSTTKEKMIEYGA